jgi:methyl-accepting chemotaxis protein
MAKKNGTIFKKLLSAYMILIIAVMFILAVLLSLGYNSYVLSQKQGELHSAAVQAASLVERYGSGKISGQELKRSLDILSYMTESRIYAIKLSKEILDTTRLSLDQDLADRDLIDELKANINGQEGLRKKQYSSNFGAKGVFVGLPLKNQAEIEGAILVFAPLNEINAMVARINLFIWGAALIAVILSGIVIYSISLKISRPLKTMEEGARRIAAGEQIEDLHVESGDELEIWRRPLTI